MKSYSYINNYIGTVSISEYERVRKLVTPLLKLYHVGLRGRGRGSRNGHPKVFSPWSGRWYNMNYQSHLPLEFSDKVGLYIRVEPTDKFVNRNYYMGDTTYDVIRYFEENICPIIRDEIRKILRKNDITLQRVTEG